jgi:hypothetical protein
MISAHAVIQNGFKLESLCQLDGGPSGALQPSEVASPVTLSLTALALAYWLFHCVFGAVHRNETRMIPLILVSRLLIGRRCCCC